MIINVFQNGIAITHGDFSNFFNGQRLMKQLLTVFVHLWSVWAESRNVHFIMVFAEIDFALKITAKTGKTAFLKCPVLTINQYFTISLVYFSVYWEELCFKILNYLICRL